MEEVKSTEQTILDAAETLFLEKGFAMTSTVEIAKLAGCNQALVHYYFRSKEKLFEQIFEKKAELILFSVTKDDDPNLPFQERLRKMIESHFDFIKDNPKLPFMFFNEMATNPKRLKVMVEKMSRIPSSILAKNLGDLKKEIEEGRMRDISPYILIQTIVSLNIAPFLMSPLFKEIVNLSDDAYGKMMEKRKQENVLIIMRSLMP